MNVAEYLSGTGEILDPHLVIANTREGLHYSYIANPPRLTPPHHDVTHSHSPTHPLTHSLHNETPRLHGPTHALQRALPLDSPQC